MLINTSLRKLIKGKVFPFSSPNLNLGGDRAAGDGTVNAFTVCLSLRGLLLAASGKPSILSRSTFQLILSQESSSSERPSGLYTPDPCPQNAANAGREKARVLFTEEGAGERKEKRTAQGATRQKPFLSFVTHLGALPRDGPVPGGGESTHFHPLRCAVRDDGS